MFVQGSDGNVGIGTTNFIATGAKLQVKGTSASPGISGSNFAGSIFSVEGTSTVNISMGTTGASSYDGWIQVHDAGNGTNYDLLLNPIGGKVGIGTSSPAQLIHWQDCLWQCWYMRIERASQSTGQVGLQIGGGTSSVDWFTYIPASSNDLAFFGNSAERMRIDSAGRVGIAAAPQSGIKLKVVGSGQEHTIYCTGDNAGYAPLLVDNSASSGTRYFASFRINNSTKGNITSTGSVMVYGGTSDYRLKENVVNLTGATDRLKQLRPKRFNFIGDTEIVDGFLAHEVDAVVPVAVVGEKDAVDENGEVDAQQMDNGLLVPLLVATIQELEARLTALENN